MISLHDFLADRPDLRQKVAQQLAPDRYWRKIAIELSDKYDDMGDVIKWANLESKPIDQANYFLANVGYIPLNDFIEAARRSFLFLLANDLSREHKAVSVHRVPSPVYVSSPVTARSPVRASSPIADRSSSPVTSRIHSPPRSRISSPVRASSPVRGPSPRRIPSQALAPIVIPRAPSPVRTPVSSSVILPDHIADKRIKDVLSLKVKNNIETEVAALPQQAGNIPGWKVFSDALAKRKPRYASKETDDEAQMRLFNDVHYGTNNARDAVNRIMTTVTQWGMTVGAFIDALQEAGLYNAANQVMQRLKTLNLV